MNESLSEWLWSWGSYCISLFVVDSVVSNVVTHVLFTFLQMKIYSMTIWPLALHKHWRQTPLFLMHIGWRAVQVLELFHLFRNWGFRVYDIFSGYLFPNVFQLTFSHAGIMLREMLQWPRPLPLEDERARLLCEVFVVYERVISQECFSLSYFSANLLDMTCRSQSIQSQLCKKCSYRSGDGSLTNCCIGDVLGWHRVRSKLWWKGS